MSWRCVTARAYIDLSEEGGLRVQESTDSDITEVVFNKCYDPFGCHLCSGGAVHLFESFVWNRIAVPFNFLLGGLSVD
jgi:hypothetical protein